MEMPYPNGMLKGTLAEFKFRRATVSYRASKSHSYELIGTCTDLVIVDEEHDFILSPYEHREDLSLDRLMSSASVRALR